jgi:hypothetical protein
MKRGLLKDYPRLTLIKGKKMKKVIAAIALSLFVSGAALAHSGGTDAYGCHTDHKTGFYHCH